MDEELTEPPAATPKLFTPAHAQFLEGLEIDEFWDHAFELAKQAPIAYNADAEYLYCGFADTYCLLPLAVLQEVIPTPLHVTHLPSSPLWMVGVVVWRGEIISVVDLAAYFLQTPPLAHASGSKLVVLQHNNITLSLRVSSVQVVTKTKGQVSLLSTQETQPQDNMYTAWYADGLVLDVETLCTDIVQHIGAFSSHA